MKNYAKFISLSNEPSAVFAREFGKCHEEFGLYKNDTYVIYYGSALLAVYMLLAGLFFGGFFCHDEMWRSILEKRLGVSRLWQVMCGFITGLLPMLVTGLLPFTALAVPPVRERLNVRLSSEVIALMLLTIAFCVLYFMVIYRNFWREKECASYSFEDSGIGGSV